MRHSARLAIVLLVYCSNFASAWYGTVKFYADSNFEGPTFPWGITETQRCYNLSCWNNRASSVKWDGLPKKGSFDGKSRIVFYTEKNCKGAPRHWPTIDDDYPKNFKLDFINDKVTSFMVWENSKKVTNGFSTPCPWGTS